MCDGSLPLISVIVPAYNAENVVARCLNSILGQTHKNLEVIVVNDGSTDGTRKVLEDYACRDSRVRVLHTENGGVSAARNLAIAQSAGRYIAFADSDDWFEADAMERLLAALCRADADIAMGQYAEEPTKGQGADALKDTQLLEQDDFLRKVFRDGVQRPYYYIWDKLYKSECVPQDCFPAGLRMGEDVEAVVRMGILAHRIVEIPEVVYHYYQNPQGVCLSKFSDRDLDLETVWNRIVDLIGKRMPHMLPYAQINRKRLNFTLLCRLILCDDRKTDIQFHQEEKRWHKQLAAQCAELTAANIPLGRKALMIALAKLYRPTKWAMRLGNRLLRRMKRISAV